MRQEGQKRRKLRAAVEEEKINERRRKIRKGESERKIETKTKGMNSSRPKERDKLFCCGCLASNDRHEDSSRGDRANAEDQNQPRRRDDEGECVVLGASSPAKVGVFHQLVFCVWEVKRTTHCGSCRATWRPPRRRPTSAAQRPRRRL